MWSVEPVVMNWFKPWHRSFSYEVLHDCHIGEQCWLSEVSVNGLSLATRLAVLAVCFAVLLLFRLPEGTPQSRR